LRSWYGEFVTLDAEFVPQGGATPRPFSDEFGFTTPLFGGALDIDAVLIVPVVMTTS